MTKTDEIIIPEGEPVAAEQTEVIYYNAPGGLDDEAAAAKQDELNPPVPQGNLISEEMAGYILQFPFAVMANYFGEHWKLKNSELDLMKPPASKVFSDLFGKYVEKNPEAYMLCYTLLACVGVRAAITIKETKEKQKEQAREQAELEVLEHDRQNRSI